jgi:hypothetical protein
LSELPLWIDGRDERAVLNLRRVIADIVNAWYADGGFASEEVACESLGLVRATLQNVKKHGNPNVETLQSLIDGIAGGDVIDFFLRHEAVRSLHRSYDRAAPEERPHLIADRSATELHERTRVLERAGLLEAYHELTRAAYETLRKLGKRLPPRE